MVGAAAAAAGRVVPGGGAVVTCTTIFKETDDRGFTKWQGEEKVHKRRHTPAWWREGRRCWCCRRGLRLLEFDLGKTNYNSVASSSRIEKTCGGSRAKTTMCQVARGRLKEKSRQM